MQMCMNIPGSKNAFICKGHQFKTAYTLYTVVYIEGSQSGGYNIISQAPYLMLRFDFSMKWFTINNK